jgi:hypothetical protein
METSSVIFLVCTVLYVYAASGCWMLQVVSYPTYTLVGEKEFVPFHIAFGRKLLPVFVGPAVMANLASFVLLLMRPSQMPFWVAALVALCSLTILLTTILIEVPKHQALDKDGKSEVLIQGLVRDNLPRALSWTVGSIALLWTLVGMLR